MGPAHISKIMRDGSTKPGTSGKSQKAYRHSWCLPGDNVETFDYHPWEEEPTPEPDGLLPEDDLLVNTKHRSLTVYPTRNTSYLWL